MRIFLLFSGAQEHNQPPSDVDGMVTVAADNQLRNDRTTARFCYRERRTSDKGSKTYQLIESDAGTLERLIETNDRPLNDAQQRSESLRVDRVRNNPEIMRKAQQDDRKEAQRREKLIQILPTAFLYTIEATEDEGRVVRIDFRPNSHFKPTSREIQICRGLEGKLWIDSQSLMFMKAQGKLVRDVNFGWGFLGNLEAGGNFLLDQTEISPGVWRITTLRVNFTGSELLFKPIRIHVDNEATAFLNVPDHLSLEDAVQILRRAPHDAMQSE